MSEFNVDGSVERDISRSVVVTGAGGFIGGYLVADLLEQGYEDVRAVDVKPTKDWFQIHGEAENLSRDLRRRKPCFEVLRGADHVYNLAADMGGIGFIEHNKTACMMSVLINTHLLEAAVENAVKRYFYSSSACVYPMHLQDSADVTPLKEQDAYPADAEDGYGWEKLFSERMCRHVREDYGIETRVARYHNIYGPLGTYRGGREKAPAALARKTARAKLTGDRRITIWGDGTQTRSFTWIGDCVEGTQLIMHGGCAAPLNLGSDQLISIDSLVSMLEEFANIELDREYDTSKPQGVSGRNSDNTKIERELRWSPSTSVRNGMRRTYDWIEAQVRKDLEGTGDEPNVFCVSAE